MNKECFIGQVAPAAQANMREFGILASVTLLKAPIDME
jgi:hypothetical protein